MNLGKYINEKFSQWSVSYSDALIEVELNRLGLSASDTITGASNLDEFFYNVLPDILLLPTNVSEGGYSVSYDKDALTAHYKLLAERLGKPDLLSKNKIRDASNKW